MTSWILDDFEGKATCQICSILCWAIQKASADCLHASMTGQQFDAILNGIVTTSPFLDDFIVTISEPTLSPPFMKNDQKDVLTRHPFICAVNHEKRKVVLAMRATLFQGCLADFLTDLNIFSNFEDWQGPRHDGFAKRAETIPIQFVLDWISQDYEVTITGHSLGGAVAQLYTVRIIDQLILNGKPPESTKLKCITFGTPQPCSFEYWKHIYPWFNHFYTFVHGGDIVFRLCWLGKKVIEKLISAVIKLGVNILAEWDNTMIISYVLSEALDTTKKFLFRNEVVTPHFGIFGRYYFTSYDNGEIRTKRLDKSDHINEGLPDVIFSPDWYKELIRLKLIPSIQSFTLREVWNHGCYWHCIHSLCSFDCQPKFSGKYLSPRDILKTNSFSATLTMQETAFPKLTLNGNLSPFLVHVGSRVTKVSQYFHSPQPFSPDGFRCGIRVEIILQYTRELMDHLNCTNTLSLAVATSFGEVSLLLPVTPDTRQLIDYGAMLPSDIVNYAYWEVILSLGKTTTTDSNDWCRLLCDHFTKLFSLISGIGNSGKFDQLMAEFRGEIVLHPKLVTLAAISSPRLFPVSAHGEELENEEIKFLGNLLCNFWKLENSYLIDSINDNAEYLDFVGILQRFCGSITEVYHLSALRVFQSAFLLFCHDSLGAMVEDLQIFAGFCRKYELLRSDSKRSGVDTIIGESVFQKFFGGGSVKNMPETRESWFSENMRTSCPMYQDQFCRIRLFSFLREVQKLLMLSKGLDFRNEWLSTFESDVSRCLNILEFGLPFLKMLPIVESDSDDLSDNFRARAAVVIKKSKLQRLELNFLNLAETVVNLHKTRHDYETVVKCMGLLLPALCFCEIKFTRINLSEVFSVTVSKQREWARKWEVEAAEKLGLLEITDIFSDTIPASRSAFGWEHGPLWMIPLSSGWNRNLPLVVHGVVSVASLANELKVQHMFRYWIGRNYWYEQRTLDENLTSAKALIARAMDFLCSRNSITPNTEVSDPWQILQTVLNDKQLEFADVNNWDEVFTHPPLNAIKNYKDKVEWLRLVPLFKFCLEIRTTVLAYAKKKVLLCGVTGTGKSTLFRHLINVGDAPVGYFDPTKNTRCPLQLLSPQLGTMIVDTPGIDDNSGLGSFYIEKIVPHAAMAIVVATIKSFGQGANLRALELLLEEPGIRKILLVFNKIDGEVDTFAKKTVSLGSSWSETIDTDVVENIGFDLDPTVQINSLLQEKFNYIKIHFESRKGNLTDAFNNKVSYIPAILELKHRDLMRKVSASYPNIRTTVKDVNWIIDWIRRNLDLNQDA